MGETFLRHAPAWNPRNDDNSSPPNIPEGAVATGNSGSLALVDMTNRANASNDSGRRVGGKSEVPARDADTARELKPTDARHRVKASR